MTPGQKKVEEAFAAFDWWRKCYCEQNPDQDLSVLELAELYGDDGIYYHYHMKSPSST